MVDVEAGPAPISPFRLREFGAVKVSEHPELHTFHGVIAPHDMSAEIIMLMQNFREWIGRETIGHPVFCSDNPAYDWQWINTYFHRYVGLNPFGHSARRIGDLWAGMKGNARNGNSWKRFRKTPHDHMPVRDAVGNVEALLHMRDMGLRLPVDP